MPARTSPEAADPRVAIASVGLGRIQRGYERYFAGIFDSVRNSLDIVLFKSAGPRLSHERVPAFLGPMTAACRILPLGAAAGAGEYTTYKHDCLAFALTMLPHLQRNEFDVVHVIDYPLAIALLRLRRVFRYRARVIFSDGGLMPPQFYPPADHVHVTAQAHFLEALAYGIPQSRTTMIPCGFYASQFMGNADRRELRRKHGISESTFVILSVAAINRGHKRVDHIVNEASRLEGDFMLWMDGRPEDRSVIDLAREKLGREKLGDRFRLTHVPTAEVADLYHMADVFVHAALAEGFGLTVCEAAAAGLKVLVHDSPHFEWLVGERDCLVDMSAPGELARRLRELMASRQSSNGTGKLASSVRDRFDWETVAPAYKDMYIKVAAMKSAPDGSRH